MNDRSTEDIRADENELRQLIQRLDELVPREGAWVQLSQYGGGPDEGQFVGNQNGYRRFGIEFLTATLDDTKAVNVELDYLVLSNSTMNFDWFERLDAPAQRAVSHSWVDRTMAIGCSLLCAIAAIVFLIGFGTVISWLFS